MILALAALVICAIAMVIALVPYARAEVARAAARAPVPLSSAGRAWRAMFVAAWAGIAVAAVILVLITPEGLTTANAGILVIVIGGWWLAFGGILWLARALARAGSRDGTEPQSSAVAIGRVPAHAESAPPPPRAPQEARRGDFRATVSFWGSILGLFVVICLLGVAFPPLAAWPAADGNGRVVVLTVAACLAGLGALLFGAGTISLALRRGEPMTGQDARDLFRTRTAASGPLRWSRSVSSFRGDALGRSADIEVPIAAVKRAWHTGVWRTDPIWRAIYAMLFGGASLGLAGVIFFIAVASPLGKAFIAAVALYTVLRLAWTFARA